METAQRQSIWQAEALRLDEIQPHDMHRQSTEYHH